MKTVTKLDKGKRAAVKLMVKTKVRMEIVVSELDITEESKDR